MNKCLLIICKYCHVIWLHFLHDIDICCFVIKPNAKVYFLIEFIKFDAEIYENPVDADQGITFHVTPSSKYFIKLLISN